MPTAENVEVKEKETKVVEKQVKETKPKKCGVAKGS